MDPSILVPILQQHPEYVGIFLAHVVFLVAFARFLDWFNPIFGRWAKSTPSKADDRVHWVTTHLAIFAHWLLRLARALLPAGRVEPSPFADRPAPRPFPPTAMIVLLLALAPWSLIACGPTVSTTAARFDEATARCEANEAEIARTCPTQRECAPPLLAERERCDAELARICSANRRARGVCADRGAS